jgi:hypothetical protein
VHILAPKGVRGKIEAGESHYFALPIAKLASIY